jgi:hypothetical protein
MLPQFACFLDATLSCLTQRKELDWSLHTTTKWEKRSPFHLYVQPYAAATLAPGQVSCFPQFTALPTELQLCILGFCSTPTLFQIMRVSQSLRLEASKLFWSDPNMYFFVEAYWLIGGGYPGHTCWDLGFLACVQGVEIEFDSGTINDLCPRPDGKVEIQQDRIADFWSTFQRRFPNAKRVLISYPYKPAVWWKDAEPVLEPLRVVVQACPPGVEAQAFVLEEQPLSAGASAAPLHAQRSWQHSIYQPTASNVWAKIETRRHHKTILAPTKQFNGPVGRFKGLKHKYAMISLQVWALWPLMIEAMARRHFNGRKDDLFPCPSPRCTTHFAVAKEWIFHAAELHSQEWKKFEILPNETRTVFQERARVLEETSKGLDRQYNEIKAEWNRQERGEQREIERSWIEQLENNKTWDTGKPARESTLWKEFLQEMSEE